MLRRLALLLALSLGGAGLAGCTDLVTAAATDMKSKPDRGTPVPASFAEDGTPIFSVPFASAAPDYLLWQNGRLVPARIGKPRYWVTSKADLMSWGDHVAVTDPVTGQRYKTERRGDGLPKLWRITGKGREPVPMPDVRPLAREYPGLSCFSCGCGCYTQVDFIPMGGRTFLHVHGYPVQSHLRGLYELRNGQIRPVIRGHLFAPIFSKDGCTIAYTKISDGGDSVAVDNLCGG